MKKQLLMLILCLSTNSCGEDPGVATQNEYGQKGSSTLREKTLPNFDADYDKNQSKNSLSDTGKIQLKYPVIIHHGFMGGKGLGGNKKVAEYLRQRGLIVYESEVSPANTIAYRATQLQRQVDEVLSTNGVSKVNIIAHSMGGLDSRYLITTLGYGDKVASLTTLATPHRGTPVADRALGFAGSARGTLINNFAGFMGKAVNSTSSAQSTDMKAAIQQLSEDYMQNEFNPQNPDDERVYYQSWAGVSGPGSQDQMTPLLLPSWLIISRKSGKNDGVVPFDSAKWGDFRGTLNADHIDLAGESMVSSGSFQYTDFIVNVVTECGQKGF